jgi:CSLREA domain-containing protein
MRLNLAAAALALLLSSAAQAQTFTGSGFGLIPDGAGPGPANYGAPRDVQFNVSGTSGTVSAVSVAFSAAHTWVGDLKVSLISPQGLAHVLFERTGANSATSGGFNTDLLAANTYTFNDGAVPNWWTAADVLTSIPTTSARTVVAGPITSGLPAVTSLNTAFDTLPANGVWILRFEDGWNGDTGSVANASLTLTMAGVNRTVTKTADTNDGACDADCSLREALTAAQNDDLINFSSLFNTPQNIDLATALPVINRSIAIQGPGAQLLTVRRSFTAASDFRVFDIVASNAVTLSGMTISNGRVSVDNVGGGISSLSQLTLIGVHLTGNSAGSGGGVYLASAGGVFSASTFSANISTNAGGSGGGIFFQGPGALAVVNCTVSGNHSVNSAGGVSNLSVGGNSQMQIINSTVFGNTAVGVPGGIRSTAVGAGSASNVTLRNTIVAGNSPSNFETLVFGGASASIQSQDFNLSDNYNGAFTPLASDITSATPRLAPLALYGGSTPTHALLSGSPALDAGDASGQLLDQRGLSRPVDLVSSTNTADGSDIGAYEAQSEPPVPPSVLYAPAASSTINFPTGAAGIANSSISVTSSGGSGGGAVTVNNCSAPAGFTITNAPIDLTGTPSSQISGAINLSCTRGATVQSGTLSCSEVPNLGNSATRSWTLNCPAADIPNVPPNLTYAPAASSTINYSAAGAAAPIVVTPSGGSGSGISAQTTLGACQISPGGAAFPNTGIAQLSFVGNTTIPQNLNLPNCVPQAGNAVNATLSCPESLGGIPPTTRSWTLSCPAAQAGGLIVTNTSDSGAGSLRQAIIDANNNGPGSDDISFSSLFNTAQTITLSSELVVSSDMTILGPSSALLSVSGNGSVRVLRVDSGIVNITGITFTRGNSGALPGGAIRINGGELTLLGCQITDSRASDGAGILNDGALQLERVLLSGNSTTAANEPNVGAAISSGGTLSVSNTTISGNSAQASTRAAGGILIYGGSASISSSTVTNNSATSGSTRIGGVLQFGGTLTLRSSIVAGNVSNATIPDVGGAMTASFNLIGNAGTATGLSGNNNQVGTGASPLNPLLGLLSNNGGSSLTHALSAGSPALDAGSNVPTRTFDQRGAGFARVVDLAAANASDGADVGALEAQTEPLPELILRNGFE